MNWLLCPACKDALIGALFNYNIQAIIVRPGIDIGITGASLSC